MPEELTYDSDWTFDDPRLTWDGDVPEEEPHRKKRDMIYKISLGFVQGPDGVLDALAKKVVTKTTGNTHFPTPDPPLADITKADNTFMTKVAALKTGGKQATKERDDARDALVELLRQLVLYVEKIADGDPTIMLSSGFDIVSFTHAPVVLHKPAIVGIDFGAPGSVILHCGSMGQASYLKAQSRTGNGPWVEGPTTTQARNVVYPGLTSGTNYEFRVLLGAGNGQESEWSDPVGHMAP